MSDNQLSLFEQILKAEFDFPPEEWSEISDNGIECLFLTLD